ncbi:glycogen synthase GlgA [Bacillus sp. V3B]|uniref:glycogen synthase GlgA n=1 Tax=Bacillus sp. V3B TaxID=2804915 RepID=UPI0021094E01|nr:glycogen synthase GlgA [Bacillus sp. V3B]MCQ6274482.1 glycogen synthase GlgA [Bacillus sp. V3B]
MKILFAVSECVPFIKSGGLADVAGSLPKELIRLGADVRIIMPKYGIISEQYKQEMKKIAEFTVQVGWRNQYCGIEMYTYDNVIFYFVDNERYFKRDRLYGYDDDGERFAFFNQAVLESLEHLSFYPDVIHCHDWHTGMIPFLLKKKYQKKKAYAKIRTVFTIHNLQFQGIMPKEALKDLFDLDNQYFHVDELEFYGNINFMKGAIVAADKITTVSPTYMHEIQTDYYGEKLNGLLIKRKDDLSGILNGIDEEIYNPAWDEKIVQKYSPVNIQYKEANKLYLQERFALPELEVPLITMVTRLTKQKGLELIRRVFHEIMAENIQMIILGTGDPEFEHFFREMEYQYKDKFKAYIGFDDTIAHQLYGGTDLFLMPSKFEPCGLGQLIALKYGALPIVRETGGLNDTIQSYNEITCEGNGFSFTNFNAHDMLHTFRRAIDVYDDKGVWSQLRKTAMEMEFSWAQSAAKYNQLYVDLVPRSELYVLK